MCLKYEIHKQNLISKHPNRFRWSNPVRFCYTLSWKFSRFGE